MSLFGENLMIDHMYESITEASWINHHLLLGAVAIDPLGRENHTFMRVDLLTRQHDMKRINGSVT